MSSDLSRRAGSALFWKTAQLAGTKGIYLVRLLILAWLLTPEDFGLLAVAMIAIDVLLKVTNFGMLPALVQGGQVDRRHYDAAWTVGVGRSLAVTAIVFLAAPALADLLGEPRATDLMRALAFRPLLAAAGSIRVAELTRNLHFRSLAFVNLPEALVSTIVSISLAGSFGVWALVAGTLLGAASSTVMSYLLAPYHPRISVDGAAFRPLMAYGRWIFATGLITLAASAVLRGVISRELGAAELGIYFLAARLAFLPYEVASEVVGAVAFPLYARVRSDGRQVARAFRSILVGMAAVLFPTYALLIALAPPLVQEVLGPRWAGTAPVIRILAVVGIVGLFGDAVVPLLQGLGQPYKVALQEAVQGSLIVLLVWGLAGIYGLVGAALAQLVAVSATQFVNAVLVSRIFGQLLARLSGALLAIAAASGAGAAVATGIDAFVGGLPGLVAGAILGAVVVGLLLWTLDRLLKLGLVDDVPRAFPQVRALLRLSPTDG